MKKKYIALAFVGVLALGGITFLCEHRNSASEVEPTQTVVEATTEDTTTAQDIAETEVTSETSEETTQAVSATTEVATESATTESTVANEDATVQPTTEDLNTIGVTVGDSYDFEY